MLVVRDKLFFYSVKSMAVLESDKQLQLLIASSDGYIKLYDVDVQVCNVLKYLLFLDLPAIFIVI